MTLVQHLHSGKYDGEEKVEVFVFGLSLGDSKILLLNAWVCGKTVDLLFIETHNLSPTHHKGLEEYVYLCVKVQRRLKRGWLIVHDTHALLLKGFIVIKILEEITTLSWM